MTVSPLPLPRALAPGIFWLGQCHVQPYNGKILHSYNSAYLVAGDDESILIETGHVVHLPIIESQINELLGKVPPLRHLWTTHQETPHSGGVGRLLRRFPDLRLNGDVRDHHLFFPGMEDRFVPLEIGTSIDLGGTTFALVEPTIKDLNASQWGFDTSRGVLFPGDGFGYGHYHEDGFCGHVAEEAVGLDFPAMTKMFSEFALHWMSLVDMAPYVTALGRQLGELGVRLICPTHGLPITDPAATGPAIYAGMIEAGTGGA